MISDVDQALQRLLLRDALKGSDVEVVFDAPTTDWAGRRSQPVVNVYLYDIREDVKRREVMNEPVYGEDGRVTGRRPPPRRFALSYLLTAWTQRAEDEHRLLSACLGCLLRYEALPEDVLTGPLATSGSTTLVTVGLPPTADRAISDVWSALGGELKPSLDVRVVAPFLPARELPVGPPVLEPFTLDVRAAVEGGDHRVQAQVSTGGRSRPVRARDRRVGATLEEVLHGGRAAAVSSSTRSLTDADADDADVAGRDRSPTAADADPADAADAADAVDPLDAPSRDVVGEQPGRWFRIRDVGR